MKNMSIDELIPLLLSVERGELVNYSLERELELIDDDRKFNCKVVQDKKQIGCIDYILLNLFDTKLDPSLDIKLVENEVDNCRLASYLMSYFFITNPNIPKGSIIQFNGIGEHRRGDLDNLNAQKTFGGSRSQYLHWNFLFRPQLRLDLIDNLLFSPDCFDTSADLVSNSNDDDSYFSKTVSMQINSWSMNDSEKINLLLDSAYSDFISSLNFVKEYARLDSFITQDNLSGRISKKKIDLDKQWLKKSFLSKYNSLYNNTLESFKELRNDLKNDLLNDYDSFINHLKENLKSLIVPFIQESYDKIINNVMNSRGIKEIYNLINNFEPDKAGIPLPCVEKMTKGFDLLVNYFKKK